MKDRITFTHAIICLPDGTRIEGHGHGNNVAFACPACRHPVLACARTYMKGSAHDRPTNCPKCNAGYWVDYRHDNEPPELMTEWAVIMPAGVKA